MYQVPSTRITPIVIHPDCNLFVLVHDIVHDYIYLTTKKTSAIICRADIHSHLLVPPPWRFLYLTFALTIFRATLHVPYIFTSSVTSHVTMDRVI